MLPIDDEEPSIARTDREILIELRKDVKYMTRTVVNSVNDHEIRIRVLENFRWWLVGGIVVSGALASVVAKLIR
jgi:hypothetical protein